MSQPPHPVTIERTRYPAIHMAFRTYAGPVEGIAEALPALVQAVRDAGSEPAGPPVALFPSTEQDPRSLLVRLCVPVPPSFVGGPGLRTLTLEPVEVAVAHFLGRYADIGQAYDALSTWVDDEGLAVGEGVSETFVCGPLDGAQEDEWRTDVAVRIKPVTSPG